MADRRSNKDPSNPELEGMLRLLRQTSAMLGASSLTIEADYAANAADLKYLRQEGEQVACCHFDIFAGPSGEFEGPDMLMTLSFETTLHAPGKTWIRTGVTQPQFVPPGTGCEFILYIHPLDEELQKKSGLGTGEWVEYGVYGSGEAARVSCSGPNGVCYDITNQVSSAYLEAMLQQASERAI